MLQGPSPLEELTTFLVVYVLVLVSIRLLTRRWIVSLVAGLPIAVVVWILFVPRLDRVPVRSLLARTDADLRAISAALEAFHRDQARYPTLREYYAGAPMLEMQFEDGENLRMTLTSPIQYLDKPRGDLFAIGGEDRAYHYWSDGDAWVLLARGPDRFFQASPQAVGEWIVGASPLSSEWPSDQSAWLYDPTNGITSRGDIIKTGP